MKVIISGGGTGGHIFPAISIANEIKLRHPEAEILFVGAENRMEMSKVPEAGYNIIGLPVVGLNRSNLLKNILVIKKLYESLTKAKSIVKDFNPDVAIGVGGFASGPMLRVASRRGIPTLLQEQNSYAGVTNKLLAKKASKICVAYEGMDRFFPEEKIVVTGNPIRQDLMTNTSKEEACQFFDLDPKKKTILVVGGSLGALMLNQSILSNLPLIEASNVQILWQCGKRYFPEVNLQLEEKKEARGIKLYDFISRMDLAYKASDLVISRAGASSISELCAIGKPAILIPSPNVAEDHQTKNAQALVKTNAAKMVKDVYAVDTLMKTAIDLVNNKDQLATLSQNIKKLALPNAASLIVDEIEKLIK